MPELKGFCDDRYLAWSRYGCARLATYVMPYDGSGLKFRNVTTGEMVDAGPTEKERRIFEACKAGQCPLRRKRNHA